MQTGFYLQTRFAEVVARLCDHFSAQNISVSCMLPALNILIFLDLLKTTSVSVFELEVSAPLARDWNLESRTDDHATRTEFAKSLTSAVDQKFPCMKLFNLTFLQYHSDVSFRFSQPGENVINQNRRARGYCLVPKLQISTLPDLSKRGFVLAFPIYGLLTLCCYGYQNLTDLVYEIDKWKDCSVVIEQIRMFSILLKKLTIRGAPHFDDRDFSLSKFFPALDPHFPDGWYYGNRKGIDYQGLPAIQSMGGSVVIMISF